MWCKLKSKVHGCYWGDFEWEESSGLWITSYPVFVIQRSSLAPEIMRFPAYMNWDIDYEFSMKLEDWDYILKTYVNVAGVTEQFMDRFLEDYNVELKNSNNIFGR